MSRIKPSRLRDLERQLIFSREDRKSRLFPAIAMENSLYNKEIIPEHPRLRKGPRSDKEVKLNGKPSEIIARALETLKSEAGKDDYQEARKAAIAAQAASNVMLEREEYDDEDARYEYYLDRILELLPRTKCRAAEKETIDALKKTRATLVKISHELCNRIGDSNDAVLANLENKQGREELRELLRLRAEKVFHLNSIEKDIDTITNLLGACEKKTESPIYKIDGGDRLPCRYRSLASV